MVSALSAGIVALLVVFALLCKRKLLMNRLKRYDPALASPLPPGLAIDGVEHFLNERDAAEAPLVPLARSSVRWASGRNRQTDLCLVFIHGFSASSNEFHPVDTETATALGMNLLRFRLTAHGLRPLERAGESMREKISIGSLRRDAAVAFALGSLLGKRVVILGSSTGSSLALWLAAQPWAAPRLASLILISPGFAIKKFGVYVYYAFKTLVLMLPTWAAIGLIHAIAGKQNHVQFRGLGPKASAERERQARRAFASCWTTVYPTEAAIPLVELYVSLEDVELARVSTPTLMLGSSDDPVVDFRLATARMAAMPDVQIVDVRDAENPHVLTGEIASPSTVSREIDRFTGFLRRQLRLAPPSRSSPARRATSPKSASPSPRPNSITSRWPR